MAGGGATLEQARAARQKALARLAGLAHLNGIGIVRLKDGYGLKVNLERPAGRVAELPELIDGVPVRVEVVGPVRARGGRRGRSGA